MKLFNIKYDIKNVDNIINNIEYYFYDNISKYVPIKIPEFYYMIKDEDFNNLIAPR